MVDAFHQAHWFVIKIQWSTESCICGWAHCTAWHWFALEVCTDFRDSLYKSINHWSRCTGYIFWKRWMVVYHLARINIVILRPPSLSLADTNHPNMTVVSNDPIWGPAISYNRAFSYFLGAWKASGLIQILTMVSSCILHCGTIRLGWAMQCLWEKCWCPYHSSADIRTRGRLMSLLE
jgi:hypothetical protein